MGFGNSGSIRVDSNKQKEQFSNAFVVAVAAAAGFVTGKWDVDDDSIDWQIAASGGRGTLRSPRLELQLKCTANPSIAEGSIRFPLSAKNYEDLIPENLSVPRILVVVIVPTRVSDWFTLSDESLILRNCAYWASLRGLKPSENEFSVTVDIPTVRRFDVSALRAMMERIRAGQLP
jgi:hypothetical protein